MKTALCLQPKEEAASLLITDPIECVKNVGYRFRIDPVHGSVVNIGYLKESTHSVVTGTANTPDDLPHPPFSFDVISDVLRILDDHEGPLPDRLQVRRVWVRAW